MNFWRKEVIDFALGVRDIDGHVYGAQIQAGEVQQYRIHGLVDLRGHAIARRDAPGRQCGCEPGGLVPEARVAQLTPFGREQKRPVRAPSCAPINPVGGIFRGCHVPEQYLL